jgi:hypothetical protein
MRAPWSVAHLHVIEMAADADWTNSTSQSAGRAMAAMRR